MFLVCIGLMWMIQQFIPNKSLLFESRNFIVFGLMILGGSIAVLGMIEFARKSTTVNPHKPENTKEFVQSGVYKFTRNPMYLGLLIVVLSPVFYWGNAATLIIPPLFVWYMNEFQIKPEEEVMEQKFGKAFVEYRKEVRRWI